MFHAARRGALIRRKRRGFEAMTRDDDSLDPRGLIREAYRIEGIDAASCRVIFLDWALGLPADADTSAAISALIARHGAEASDHPMTVVLREGAERPPSLRPRRGRRRG